MDSNYAFLTKKINSYENDKIHIIRHIKDCTDRNEKQRLSIVLDDVCNELDNYQALFNMYFKREELQRAG